MGWSSCSAWKSPKDILREVSDPSFLGSGVKILRTMTTNYGRHIWMAVEKEGKRYIYFFLIEGKAPNLAYKSMSESMGPCYYDCPLSLLDMVPEDMESQYAAEWRSNVRKHHAKRSEKFEVGQPVTVYGKPYTIKGMDKRSYLIESPEGRVYKCSAAKMNRVANG